MSEYLSFWPKSGIGGYFTSPGALNFYSPALSTNGFTEVVIQMEIDADFGTVSGTKVQAIPQISNDGVYWKVLGGTTVEIAATGSFPKQITGKFTEIGAFMRMWINFVSMEGAANWIVATVLITGIGRS